MVIKYLKFFWSESKKESNEELKIDNLIKSIKGYEKWSHIWGKKVVYLINMKIF